MNKIKRQKEKERRALQAQLKKDQERAPQVNTPEGDDEEVEPVVNNFNLIVKSDRIAESDFDSLKALARHSDEPEDISKDYGETMGPMMPMPGPTSFEEMDAMEMAREQASHVREVTWKVQDLVANILYDPASSPDEKSAKMQKVATEFKTRVNKAMAMAEEMHKDLDILEVEAILATDDRHRGVFEKAKDFIKEKLSSEARAELSDSDFALVYEEDGKKVRKYPIQDAAHCRNALARAAQQMKAGGEAAADAKKAMPKIRAAAKKFGIDMSMEKGIHIEKDAKGDWRWIGRPTNNFIDWQTDILSKSAHKKYIAWLDANPELAPVFLSWHTPGTRREHPVDFWMEQDGAVIMSGILTEPEAAALFEVQKEVDLGMSFQGLGMRLDPTDKRVVSDYWMYEVSDLPVDRAANPFTSLETMTKEVGMDKLEYLTKIMGSEEKAKAYLDKTAQSQQALAEAGITSKEKTEEPEKEPKAPVTPPPTVPGLDMTAIVKAVGEQIDIEGLNAFVAQAQEAFEKVGVLEELVKDLRQSHEDKLAEALTPPAARFAWSQTSRASQSDKTKLRKDDEGDQKLEKSLPGVPEDYWLSKATNTAPIPVETS